MQQIEEAGVPAPSPIEQRWTASSSAPMSPAAERGHPDTVHSWVGIIMYLPTEDQAQRQAITDRWRMLSASSCVCPRCADTMHEAKH